MRLGFRLRCAAGGTPGGTGVSTSYGPFTATAKARVARERRREEQQSASAPTTPPHGTAATRGPGPAPVDVMQNIQLPTNLHLRLSLASLPHPSQLQRMAYQSPEWRQAMIRLYRTILRLHNKEVAVSVDQSRRAGPAQAVASATGVRDGGGGPPAETVSAPATTPTHAEDHFLRYLLSPQQREFGNRFVQGEFRRHLDADAVYSAIFYESWHQYVLQLASGVTDRELTEEERRLLSPDQKAKLAELHSAFTSIKSEQGPTYMI